MIDMSIIPRLEKYLKETSDNDIDHWEVVQCQRVITLAYLVFVLFHVIIYIYACPVVYINF